MHPNSSNFFFSFSFLLLWIICLISVAFSFPCSFSYYSATGEDPCIACPEDRTTAAISSKGIKSCICRIGFYTNTRGGCVKCPAGKTTLTEGAIGLNSCVCARGTFGPSGDGSCRSCPDTFTSNPGALSETDCFLSCNAGQYLDRTTRPAACKDCLRGSWSPPGALECNSTCPSGTGKASGNPSTTVKCDICKPGEFRSPNSARCVSCNSGTYNLDDRQDKCIVCPNERTTIVGAATSRDQCVCRFGTYGPLSPDSKCKNCRKGLTTDPPATAAKQCKLCSAGTTIDEEHGFCFDCPPGSFNPIAGRLCKICPAGSHTTAFIGSTQCIRCAKGLVSAAGSTQCSEVCLAGTGLLGREAQHNRKLLGSSSSFSSSQECLPCSPGKFSSGLTTVCEDCPQGTFSNLPGSAFCPECPFHSTSPPGSAQCYCAAKKDQGARIKYVPCPNGFDELSQVCTCLPCPPSTKPNDDGTRCVIIKRTKKGEEDNGDD